MSKMPNRLEDIEVVNDLFKDVKYYVVGSISNQIEKLLVDGGARKSMYLADMVTIAISDDAHNCEVEEARDVFDIPVVTSRWIVLSAKCGTRLPTVGFKADGNQLFSDIVACPTQLLSEDANVAWAMITFYGGHFQLKLDKNCTHLIAGAAEGKKYTTALLRDIKIVTPDWVVDCVKKKIRLEETRYHPRLLEVPSPELEIPIANMDAVDSTVSLFGNLTTLPTPANILRARPETPKVESTPIQIPKNEGSTTLESCMLSEATGKVSAAMMAARTTSCAVPVPAISQSLQMHNQGSVNVTWSKDCISTTSSVLGQNIVSVGRGIPIRGIHAQVQLPLSQLQQQQLQQQQQQQQQQLQQQQQQDGQQFAGRSAAQNPAAGSWDAQQQLQLQRQQKMQELLQQAKQRQGQVQGQPQSQQQQSQQQPQPRANVGMWHRPLNPPVPDVSMQPGVGRASQLQQQQQQQASQLRAMMHSHPQGVQQRATTPQQFQQQQRAWLMTQGREGAPQLGQPQLGQPQPPLQVQQQQQQQQQHPPMQWQQQQQQPVRDTSNQLVGQPQPSLPNTWPQHQQPNQGVAVKTISHAAAVQRKVQWQQQQQLQQLQQQQQQQQLQQQQKGLPQELRENAVPTQQQLQWQQQQQQQQQQQVQQPPNMLMRENMRLQQQQLQSRGECAQPVQQQQPMNRDNVMSQTPAKMLQQQTMSTPAGINPQQLQQLQQQTPQVQLQQRAMSVSRVSTPALANFQVAASGGPRLSTAAHLPVPNQQNVCTVGTGSSSIVQAQQPLPHDRLHHVVQQGQQQIQQQLQSLQAQAQLSQPTALSSQSQQVTPKTKTALAIMLNTRLQNSPRLSDFPEMSGQPQVANLPVPTTTVTQITTAISPRAVSSSGDVTGFQSTLRNITNSSQVVSPVKNVPTTKSDPAHVGLRPVPRETAVPAQPQVPFVQYYGHDPSLKVPPEKCLVGCVFLIVDYDRIVAAEEMQLWKRVIKKYNGEVETSYGTTCTHILCDNMRNSVVQQALREGKRCVTAYWLNDVLLQKRLRPPWMALHFPTPFSDDKPCKAQKITVSLFEGEERAHLKAMIQQSGAEYTGYMSRKNSILICRKPEGIKYEKAREWDISIVNVQWLHDILFGHLEAMRLPLAQKYQQFGMDNPFSVDYALVPHLMTAWKVPIQIPDELWKKILATNSSLSTQIKESQNEDVIGSVPKRPRLSPELEENVPLTTNYPPSEGTKPFVMFTGIADSKALARNVLQLGGVLTTSSKQCTHLITDALSRTVKLLCAINNCKFILTRGWIVDSFKQNRFTDEKAYILTDYKNEKHFGCNIRQTLFRSSRTPIFNGLAFYITPGVRPCLSIMKEVIECAGGNMCKKKPSKSELLLANTHGPKIIVISCDNDIHLCQSWVQHKIPIQNAEFVLTGVMKQEVDYQSFLIPNCAPSTV